MRKAKQLAKAILTLRQAENDLVLAKERLEDMGEDVAKVYSEALIKASTSGLLWPGARPPRDYR